MQHYLLGLCTSLLGRMDEEELFFSLLYLILKVDIPMGPKEKKERETDYFEIAPHQKVYYYPAEVLRTHGHAVCSHDTRRILTTNY